MRVLAAVAFAAVPLFIPRPALAEDEGSRKRHEASRKQIEEFAMEAYSPELIAGGIAFSAGGGATMIWGFASMFDSCEADPNCEQQRSNRGFLVPAGAIAVVTGVALIALGKERVPKLRHPGRSRRAVRVLGRGAACWSF